MAPNCRTFGIDIWRNAMKHKNAQVRKWCVISFDSDQEKVFREKTKAKTHRADRFTRISYNMSTSVGDVWLQQAE